MKKDRIVPMPEYFDRYINKTDDVDCKQALEISMQELQTLPVDRLNALGSKVYAPGKWTINDIFQHMIDTERVFTYRATAFARGQEGKVLSYDEELYARNAAANARTLEDIVEELILARRSFIALYKSFTEDMLLQTGEGIKGPYSVLSIGFLIAGHQRWHLDIIKEKYLPLG